MSAHYDLEPILVALHIDLERPGRGGAPLGKATDDPLLEGWEAAAQTLHTTTRTLLRQRHKGLTEQAADRYATAIGCHPSMLWPTWSVDVQGDHDWFSDDPPMDSLGPIAHGAVA